MYVYIYYLWPIGNGLGKLPCSCQPTSFFNGDCAATRSIQCQAIRQDPVLGYAIYVEASSHPPQMSISMPMVLFCSYFFNMHVILNSCHNSNEGTTHQWHSETDLDRQPMCMTFDHHDILVVLAPQLL